MALETYFDFLAPDDIRFHDWTSMDFSLPVDASPLPPMPAGQRPPSHG